FNTVASFITNTNWQAYSGEVSLSYFSQMVMVQFMMFMSPATAFAAAAAIIRGFTRAESGSLGNFWVDLTRITYRFLLPLCFAIALLFVWQGETQTLSTNATVNTVEGETQEIARGPVASLSSVKHIGTNGGGFFSQNSSHPFENPTNLVNAVQLVSMLLLSASTVYAFGLMISRRKQGWALFAAYAILFVGSLAFAYSAERNGNPILTEAGADQSLTAEQSGGSMEGKEVRFGPSLSSMFTAVTTAAETGSVNNMHDSLTPLGGLVAIFNIQFTAVFGGVGVGFIYLIQYVVIAVFIVGLMVGRSPEFLGKKIEAREVSLAVLALLIGPACILGFTGLAMVWPGALDSLNNPNAHGFSEILYAYSTATQNNGSAFEGITDDTYFYNTTVGLAMLVGRYATIVPLVAVAGSLAAKKRVPESAGTFSTATPTFAVTLVATVVIVGGLTFFPAWALGPIVEHFQMLEGKTFSLGD
ncbi:MAG: potassium-transporting ATPase subunit KdpA, partial [Rubrobacter sp.]